MIGSSTPGISAYVLGADIAARTRAAEERRPVEDSGVDIDASVEQLYRPPHDGD